MLAPARLAPGQLLAYTFLTPLLLLSSYPACFLCVGVLLAYLPAVWTQKQAQSPRVQSPERRVQSRSRLALDSPLWTLDSWMVYAVFAATTASVFLWLVLGPARSQHDAAIHSCWVACMPNWERPWTVPGWVFLSSLEVCRYCCKPLGQVLALLVVPGTLLLWRSGERTMVRLMLAPILLALAAACLHAYPFGGVRVMAYAAPAILLLAAAGVPPMLAWCLRTQSIHLYGADRSAAVARHFLAGTGSLPLERGGHTYRRRLCAKAMPRTRSHPRQRRGAAVLFSAFRFGFSSAG